MKAHTATFESVRSQVSKAVILGASTTRSPAVTGKATQAAKPAHVVPQALRQETAKVREAVRRHYEKSYKNSWHHGGMNG